MDEALKGNSFYAQKSNFVVLRLIISEKVLHANGRPNTYQSWKYWRSNYFIGLVKKLQKYNASLLSACAKTFLLKFQSISQLTITNLWKIFHLI